MLALKMPADTFRDFVLEQLASLDGLRCRKRFSEIAV